MMSSVAVDPELYMETAFGALFALAAVVITVAEVERVVPRSIFDQQTGNTGMVAPSKFSFNVGTGTQAVVKLSLSVHALVPEVPQTVLM